MTCDGDIDDLLGVLEESKLYYLRGLRGKAARIKEKRA